MTVKMKNDLNEQIRKMSSLTTYSRSFRLADRLFLSATGNVHDDTKFSDPLLRAYANILTALILTRNNEQSINIAHFFTGFLYYLCL